MGHMAKAEATFQKCRKMLKIDEKKLQKTMQINSGLTTALADKQRKEKLATAKAESLQKGLKICEHVAKRIEDKYKSQLEKRNTAYNDLLKTWNTYKSKNKGARKHKRTHPPTHTQRKAKRAKNTQDTKNKADKRK